MSENNTTHANEGTQINTTQPNHLNILQINLNKSVQAHLELINRPLSLTWDIILIQEPHVTSFNCIRTPTNFRQVFPTNRGREGQVRSLIWVNKKLETKYWKIIDIPDTNYIMAIQLKGTYGKITIFNIYNDCNHSDNEIKLRNFIRENARNICQNDNNHMIWAGDFNRHHSLWDKNEDTHLFMRKATDAANDFIDILGEFELEMALPKDTPTLQHMLTKKCSRPDNVFCTQQLSEQLIRCEVDARLRPPATDHFPIVTRFLIPQNRISETPVYDFRNVDWEKFRRRLERELQDVANPTPISTERQLEEVVRSLTEAIQVTIQAEVKRKAPRKDGKRWWNGDLRKLKKKLNKLRATSFRFRALTNHPAHAELRTTRNKYGEEILRAKQQHWADFLEEATTNDIWTANRYIKEPVGDGGCPRIPTLKVKGNAGTTQEINDNKDKARHFAETFFPPPPEHSSIPQGYDYPTPIPDPPKASKAQIEEQINKLAPYKAPGPDGIPNIVIIKCFELIADYLLHIIKAIIDKGLYYDPWRESTTVVLCKPGKPNYQLAKAYRPIALINTLAKVVTDIVATDISYLAEKFELIPKTHFGGRPGRSTIDVLHYLTHRIKEAWRKKKVVSVLFLDIEGAFPNAVKKRLVHNLRKREIPTKYVKFVENLLRGRRTRLKFDDFLSEPIEIRNGIGQGDPLSMILYIIYNADLLEIVDNAQGEDALSYVDDIAILVTGKNRQETTNKLKTIMTKSGGGIEWS